MRKVATFGEGKHIVRFCFFDKKPDCHSFPVQLELVNVNIKCRDRAGVAKTLRRYHQAEIALRQNEHQSYPKYGLRYIAHRYPAADIYTTTKDGEPCHIIKYFCYHFKGFLSRKNLRQAQNNFGYQEC